MYTQSADTFTLGVGDGNTNTYYLVISPSLAVISFIFKHRRENNDDENRNIPKTTKLFSGHEDNGKPAFAQGTKKNAEGRHRREQRRIRIRMKYSV